MAIRRYGAAYQCSKSKIADEIIALLPSKKYFIDAFSGGGALAHCALESNKFEHIIANDLLTREILEAHFLWSKEVINTGGGNKNQKRSVEKLYHVK